MKMHPILLLTVMFLLFMPKIVNGQEHGTVIISGNPDFDCVGYFAERDTIVEMVSFFGEPPKIVGGYDTIQQLLKYPKGLEMYKISGNAYASVFIDTTSEILCYKIFTGLSGPFIEEVKKVLEKLEFQTASIKGKPVRIDMVLPFRFVYDVKQIDETDKKSRRRSRR